MQEYESHRVKIQARIDADRAKHRLTQMERDNQAWLLQATAEKDAAKRCLAKHEELLARYREQVEKCKIYAPMDGFVVYSRSGHERRSRIKPGYRVHRKEAIFSFPKLDSMQVEIDIPQNLLERVEVGPPVAVSVVAFPRRSYHGSVVSVAAMPTPSEKPSATGGTYRVIVGIDEDATDLIPRMTAIVDAKLGLLRDVLTVPTDAIVYLQDQPWCYVSATKGIEGRQVEVGRTIGDRVEVREGPRSEKASLTAILL